MAVTKQTLPNSDAATFRPTIEDVVHAVESLYADRIKPVGRIILKRVGEQAAQIGGSIPRIDPRRLRRLCESSRQIAVTQEGGGEYAVLLLGDPHDFVDVCSSIDPYSKELWSAATVYFEGLVGEDVCMPGGRYACAQLLAARKLPFLDGCSLGEICHIIFLAVTVHKLLGYLDGCVVPHRHSEAGIKEQCAAFQKPTFSSKRTTPQMPIADWDQARACLSLMLDMSDGTVSLPNVKRNFHSFFQMELSETALGHSKLIDLLQDERMKDICGVTRGTCGNYTVVKQLPAARPLEILSTWLGSSNVCLSTMPGIMVAACPPTVAFPARISPSLHGQQGCFDILPSPSPCVWGEHPDIHLCCSSPFEETFQPRFSQMLQQAVDDDQDHDFDTTLTAEKGLSAKSVPADSPAIIRSVRNTFLHVAPAQRKLGESRRRAKSLPRDLHLARSECGVTITCQTPTMAPLELAAIGAGCASVECTTEQRLKAKESEIAELRKQLQEAEAVHAGLKIKAMLSEGSCSTASPARSSCGSDELLTDAEETAHVGSVELTKICDEQDSTIAADAAGDRYSNVNWVSSSQGTDRRWSRGKSWKDNSTTYNHSRSTWTTNNSWAHSESRRTGWYGY